MAIILSGAHCQVLKEWSGTVNANAEQLLSQLKRVVADLEGLAAAASGSSAEYSAAASEQLKEALSSARERIGELEAGLRRGAKAADSYVRENTWASIAIAAGIAFLIGVLYRRRD
jgi:ElaB/YqjD/DUF883 family membrane-anchored ribosome-binding protein